MEYLKDIKAMEYLKEIKGGISKIKDKFTKTELQRQLKEATSNEHCHANVNLLNEIAEKTHNYNDYQVIVAHVVKKLNCRKEKWRKILKALFLIEHILKTGTPNFVETMRSESYKLKNLHTFSYIDESRADKGETIREKSRVIMTLLEDNQRLKEERKNYAKWKNRITGVGSSGSSSVSGGGTWDRYSHTSSESYKPNNWNDYQKKKEESSSSSSESESESESEDEDEDDKEKNKKKNKKKKPKKDDDDDDEEEEEDKKKKKKKKPVKKDKSDDDEEEKKPKKKEEKKIKVSVPSTSGISIKKPGEKDKKGSKKTDNNNGFEFVDAGSSSNNNVVNQGGNAKNDFDSLFGGSASTPSMPTMNQPNNANAFPDIFGGSTTTNMSSTQPINQQQNSNSFDMFSFTNPTTAPTTVQPMQNQPLGNTADDLLKNLSNLNMGGNQQQNNPMGMNMGMNNNNMGMGMNTNMGMGMGMNMGMNNNMNMGMGMGMNNNMNMGMGMNNNRNMNMGMGNNLNMGMGMGMGMNNNNMGMGMGMNNNPYQQQTMNNPMNFNMGNTSNQPKQQQQPVYNFQTSNPNPVQKQQPKQQSYNDDEFSEVIEDDHSNQPPKKTGGLNSLLDSKLVNLDNLGQKSSSSSNQFKPSNPPQMNTFNFY